MTCIVAVLDPGLGAAGPLAGRWMSLVFLVVWGIAESRCPLPFVQACAGRMTRRSSWSVMLAW